MSFERNTCFLSRNEPSDSKAFTLVEVVVMSAVGLMLMAMAYELFLSSAKDSSKTSKKLQSLQSVSLLLDRMQHDIKQAFYLKGKYEPALIYTDSTANGLSFYRVNSKSFPPDKESPLEIEKVIYQFSPVTSQMYINNKPFGIGKFKFVEFKLEDGNPRANPPVFADTVTVNIVSVSEEDSSTKLEDIDKRNTSTQVATFSFSQQAFAKYYENWVFYSPLIKLKDN